MWLQRRCISKTTVFWRDGGAKGWRVIFRLSNCTLYNTILNSYNPDLVFSFLRVEYKRETEQGRERDFSLSEACDLCLQSVWKLREKACTLVEIVLILNNKFLSIVATIDVDHLDWTTLTFFCSLLSFIFYSSFSIVY